MNWLMKWAECAELIAIGETSGNLGCIEGCMVLAQFVRTGVVCCLVWRGKRPIPFDVVVA
tara:strand:+ start:41223 stop:41402 length:180 start_codon:yes stop_codon:yes gene_type:complete